jgi:hypothetical protein
MKPRITISQTKDGDLQVWLNPAGRDLLVRKLQGLSETNDHIHLTPAGLDGDVEVQSRAYHEDDQVIQWAKFLFRPDEWDTRYFPHVMDSKVR